MGGRKVWGGRSENVGRENSGLVREYVGSEEG